MEEIIILKALEIAESKTDVRHIQELISESCEEMASYVIEQARNIYCRYCQFDCEGHPHDDCTLLQEYTQALKGE